MIKAFLSHSSQDKDSYVRRVAEQLGKDNIVYDEFTFEEGSETLTEIIKGLSSSDLFVLFISSAALDSEWVQKEIFEAHRIADNSAHLQIYPIIIDSRISHADPRIPAWLKHLYNLKPIARSSVAARRIQARLREISWSKHPQIQKRNTIFVGRNNALEQFEQRIHDFDRTKPVAIIASGFPSVGRRTFLHHALCKTGISEPYARPTAILLDRSVSIEDFLLKLNDLALVDIQSHLTSLSEKSVDEKISLIHAILDAAYASKELIYLVDEGCLINYERVVTPWFSQAITSYTGCNYPVLCIASKYRVPFRSRPHGNKFYFTELSELNLNERRRLFSQLLELYSVNITPRDFSDISELLTGFPDQVLFATDVLQEQGGGSIADKMPAIAAYSLDRASALLGKYESDDSTLDFIRLLAQFEVITSDFVFSIVEESKYFPILESLVSEHIVEPLGVDGTTLRLNDIVRDYITRNRLNVTTALSERLVKQVSKLVNANDILERDSSEYIYALKESLKQGDNVDTRLLIPSHYLRCMKDLYYNKGNLRRVIDLADIILMKEANLEFRIAQDIRYYLCLALAKSRDKRMLEEVQKIQGSEHTFLLGFYYRRCGRLEEALEQFNLIRNARFVAERAKREIVQVLVQLEDWEAALGDAKHNYEENRWNLYHTQAYFNCLVNSQDRWAHVSTLRNLIENLRSINSELSNEMADIADAIFIARIENDHHKAVDVIHDAAERWTKSYYPLLALCDIAIIFRDGELLAGGVLKLREYVENQRVSQTTLRRYQAFRLAFQGRTEDAIQLVTNEVRRFPEQSRERLISRLRAAAAIT